VYFVVAVDTNPIMNGEQWNTLWENANEILDMMER